jgi:hypothetical protein
MRGGEQHVEGGHVLDELARDNDIERPGICHWPGPCGQVVHNDVVTEATHVLGALGEDIDTQTRRGRPSKPAMKPGRGLHPLNVVGDTTNVENPPIPASLDEEGGAVLDGLSPSSPQRESAPREHPGIIWICGNVCPMRDTRRFPSLQRTGESP